MQRNCTIRRCTRALAPLVLVLASGCTSVKVTGTPRTGTEQLLLTGTWDDALYHVDFSPLAGSRVFLDAQYVTVVDKDWIISSIRRTMAEQGVLLENNKDKAQVIVEAAFGAYGTDQRDRKFGLPGISLTPSLTTGAAVSTGSSTSLNFSETNQQDAVVKARLFAYEAKTGRLVWETAPLLNAQGVRDHFVIGSGPYRLSSRPKSSSTRPSRRARPASTCFSKCSVIERGVSAHLDREIAVDVHASKGPLAPGDRHGRRRAVQVAALVFGTVLEPAHEADQLLDGFS